MLCFCFVAMGTKELRSPGIPTFAICGTSLPPTLFPCLMEMVTSREALFLENGCTECEEEGEREEEEEEKEEGEEQEGTYRIGRESRKTLTQGSDSLMLTHLSSIHQGRT